ncbi:MAG: TIGR02757 family protein [Brevinematales bacterium]|nr:TIGR02757 family protein [Brevinematales bacterium]
MDSLFPNYDSDIKKKLDELYTKYCVPEFIDKDPIQFIYKFDDEKEKELAGFIASIMAQGKRKNIIQKTRELIFDLIGANIYDYILNFDLDKITPNLAEFSYFAYRNITGIQIAYILFSLKLVLKKWKSLKNLFFEIEKKNKNKPNVKDTIEGVVEELFGWSPKIPHEVLSLVPSPKRGSACKRINMFLRWMVRKDNVDSGLWKDIIPTRKLIIPLDFHVSKISRELGLTKRQQDDWITAEEITNKLKEFDPEDPVKYDFAIFGYGVNKGDK